MASRKKNLSAAPAGRTYLVFGALFGYFLSKSRATDYDAIIAMFQWKEFQLYGVIGTAIAVIALGLFLLEKRSIPARSGQPLDLAKAEWEPNRLFGAFVLGVGWALAGTCPGTSLAQLGEGKVMALFTVLGILGGVWAFKKYGPKFSTKEDVC
jgi:uncharacterized membrane protein YedE/YeeE